MANVFKQHRRTKMGDARLTVDVTGYADLIDFSGKLALLDKELNEKVMRRVHRKLARWAKHQLSKRIAKADGLMLRALRRRIHMYARSRDMSKLWAGIQPINISAKGRVRAYGKRGRPGSGVNAGGRRYPNAFIPGGKLGNQVYVRKGQRRWSIAPLKHDMSETAINEFNDLLGEIEQRGAKLIDQELSYALSKL